MDNTFLGRGWGFPPEFDKLSSSVNMVAGKEDIDQSLRILMGTKLLERAMRPDYGCGLNALVFDTIDENTLTMLRDTIQRAVLFFEPRIELEAVDVDLEGSQEGRILITLDYTIRTTNSRSNMVYPFYYLEGTNIEP